MFKLLGAGLIILCTTFLGSQKIIKLYYTYNFLNKTIKLIKKINYERDANIIYEKLYIKIDFDKVKFIEDMTNNCYIEEEIKDKTADFFEELGKKNKRAEDDYIEYFLQQLAGDKNDYYQKFLLDKKLYILYGVSLGLFIIIILI